MTYTRQTLREAVQSALRDFDDCGPELLAAYADAAIAAMLDRLRKPDDMLFAAVASAISRNIRLEWRGHDDAIIPQHSVFDAADAALKAILDASEKERSDGQ